MYKLYFKSIILFFIALLYQQTLSQEWIKTTATPGDDKITAAVTDVQGNVYVTGYCTQTVGGVNYCTKKYKTDGTLLWTSFYNGNAQGEDRAFGIAVDRAGSSVYITGSSASFGGNIDVATIKYDALTGTQIGIYRFGDPSNLEDRAFGIAVDRIGNVYITGYITRPGIGKDIYTAKYNSSLNFIWHKTYVGNGNGEDRAFGIVTDSLGNNIFITGSTTDSATGIDLITVCYDSSGTERWLDTYPGAPTNEEDRAFGIAVDNFDGGGVYITGFVTDSINNSNYITIKYNPLTGDTVWTAKYKGPGNSIDRAFGIAVDRIGNCYVTGMSTGIETNGDYLTIKYNQEGVAAWTKRYYGLEGYKDSATSIIYSKGFVYVTGYSINDTSNKKEDVFTIKYNINGDSVQASRIDILQLKDVGVKVVADTAGNIFIGGYTYNPVTDFDWLVMKYYLGALVIGIRQISTEVPDEFMLYQNYPNPFNPETKIRFSVSNSQVGKEQIVKLVLYDVLGREAAVLVNERLKPAAYEVNWDAKDFVSGVYFYRLIYGDFSVTKKMILIK